MYFVIGSQGAAAAIGRAWCMVIRPASAEKMLEDLILRLVWGRANGSIRVGGYGRREPSRDNSEGDSKIARDENRSQRRLTVAAEAG